MRIPTERTVGVCLTLFCVVAATAVQAASARIAFDRVLPASNGLGNASSFAIARALGGDPRLETFLEDFVAQATRSGLVQVRDARTTTGAADAFLDVKTFRCDSVVQESEGTSRDLDGNRVKRRMFLIEAACSARIEVLTRTMKPQSTFFARGEGRSPRVESVTDDERNRALDEAARHAAHDAARRITPRRVRESILLDEQAPAFEDGYAMINAGRLTRARSIWEAALQKEPRSASLRFNLGALCEAMGDRQAAERHYSAAKAMAPSEPRYANELKLFARRGTQ